MKTVSMYTLSTCPWCRKTKAFFRDSGIAFDFIDYDLADEPTQARIIADMDAHGASGFPFVRIGDAIVIGWNPARYKELLAPESGGGS